MGALNFSIGKLKSNTKIAVSRKHNQRIDHCSNADPDKKHQNRQIMPGADDYAEFFRNRIRQSEYYHEHGGLANVRKDAVKMIDMVFRVPKDELAKNQYFDVDRFCEITRDWVCRTFGKENVADMILHMDEESPHIHAIVVPLTKEGKLSAASYIGSPEKLRNMQTEVANQYAEIGLSRGLSKSVAHHTEIKKFYGMIHESVSDTLPEPTQNETLDQYIIRANKAFNERKSQDLSHILELERERDVARTEVKQMQEKLNAAEQKEARIRSLENTIERDAEALRQWRAVVQLFRSKKLTPEKQKVLADVMEEALKIAEEERAAKELEEYKKIYGDTQNENKGS